MIFQDKMKNSKKKTYGAHGLMEWYCRINCGGTSVNLPFKGGTISGTGSTPAKYTTENPLLQAIIENSEHFRSGRIVLISVVEGSGRYKIAEPGDKPAPKEEDESPKGNEPGDKPAPKSFDKNPKSFDKNPKEEDESPKLPAGDPVGEQGEPGEPEAEPATEENGEVPEAITVSSLDDAKDYLNEHFGIAKSQLRSRNAIEERAKENGVVFFFKNA